MPTRLLREGILESERVDKIGPMSELFYRRLMSVVDDYGCYTAAVRVLLSRCFPTRPVWADEPLIHTALHECEQAGLIRIYKVNEHYYLEVLDFRQQVRAKNRKYPEFKDGCLASANHLTNTCYLSPALSSSAPTPTPTPSPHTSSTPNAPAIVLRGGFEPVSEPTESEPRYWSARLYARHPKKRNLPLVQNWVVQRWEKESSPIEFFREVDRVHLLWCKTEDWKKKNGAFVPKLDEWLADDCWTAAPYVEEEYRSPYREEPRPNCRKCFDTGVVVPSGATNVALAEKCDCDAGKTAVL